MTLLDVARALRRFSTVFLVVIVATAGASIFVWTQVPIVYQSGASLVVLTANQVEGPENSSIPVNPYQSAGDQSTVVATEALASISGSPEFQERLADAGVTSDTTIEVSSIGGGVILALTATNTRSVSAKADVSILADLMSQEFRARQLDAGAPEISLLTADVLVVPNDPVPSAADRTVVTGAVAVIGVILALFAVLLLEFLHRPRRKSETRPADPVFEKDESAGRAGAVTEDQPLLRLAIVAGPALVAIDRALALSRPEDERHPEPGDVPPDARRLPFAEEHGEADVAVGWPTIDAEGSSETLSGSTRDDDNTDSVESAIDDDWPGLEQTATSESAVSTDGPGKRDEESVTHWSSPDDEWRPVPAAPSPASKG